MSGLAFMGREQGERSYGGGLTCSNGSTDVFDKAFGKLLFDIDGAYRRCRRKNRCAEADTRYKEPSPSTD